MASSRMRRFVGGLGLGYLQTVVVTIVGLWLTPYLLRHLGQHEFGLWLLGAQVLGYLALADLGIVALLPREVAHATGSAGRDGAPSVPTVVEETATLIVWQTPAVAVIGLAAWLMMAYQWNELRGPLAFMVAAFVLSFPVRMFPSVLQGLQDLPYLGGVQLAAWVAGSALTVALVEAGFGLNALAAGWVATQAMTAVLSWHRLARRFPNAIPNFVSTASMVLASDRVRRGLWVSLNQVAQVLLNGTDLIVVGWFLGPAAVVVYSCTGRLVTMLANQPQMFMQMAVPALSELRAEASRKRLFEVSSAMSQAMLLGSGAIACVVLAVNEGFTTWWVGAPRFGGTVLTTLMLLSMMLRHWNLATGYTLYSLGHERRLALTGIADGVVTVASMLVLIPRLGLNGAVLASIIGVCIVSLPGNVRALARDEGVSVASSLSPLRTWSISFGLVAATVAAVSTLWAPRSVWALAFAGAAVSGLYLLSMIRVLTAPPIGPRVAQGLGSWLAIAPPLQRLFDAATPEPTTTV